MRPRLDSLKLARTRAETSSNGVVRRWLAVGLLASAVSSATAAEPATPAPPPDPCKFPAELPPDAIVLAAGGYAGRRLPYAIDDKSNHQASSFEVLVHQPGSSIVLMLGAYDPGVWRVKWTEGTRIVGLYLGGYYKQILEGLPESVPKLQRFAIDDRTCPHFYVGESELLTLNPIARRVLGKPITRVFFAEEGRIQIGKAPAGLAFLTEESPSASAPSVTRVAAGRAGLLEAVAGATFATRAGTMSTPGATRSHATALRLNLPCAAVVHPCRARTRHATPSWW